MKLADVVDGPHGHTDAELNPNSWKLGRVPLQEKFQKVDVDGGTPGL